jgi:diacylglycerol kinase family enzyme
MYKYRFKTKDEFFRESGENWRYEEDIVWVENMDHLLGRSIINKAFIEIIENRGSCIFYCNITNHNWNITKRMIVKVKDNPNYNPKKLCYD